jgi:hypothetical protein
MSVTFNFKGSGVDGLNVSNRNATIVCDMIGVTWDYCGDVSPATVIANLSVANPSPIETTDNYGIELSEDGVKPVCRMIDFGVSQDRLAYYAEAMLRLAVDAQAVGEEIYWG